MRESVFDASGDIHRKLLVFGDLGQHRHSCGKGR